MGDFYIFPCGNLTKNDTQYGGNVVEDRTLNLKVGDLSSPFFSSVNIFFVTEKHNNVCNDI